MARNGPFIPSSARFYASPMAHGTTVRVHTRTVHLASRAEVVTHP